LWNGIAGDCALLLQLWLNGCGDTACAGQTAGSSACGAADCRSVHRAGAGHAWDVAVVRIITVVGFFFSGGLVAVAYLAGWIGIPEEPIPLPPAYPPSV